MTARAQPFSLGSYFAGTLPPLDGRLRFVVLALLLLLARDMVFGSMLTRVATCPEGFYQPEGIMTLGPKLQSDVAAWAERLRTPMLVAWICGALGLFGRWSMLFTGLCLLLVQGFWRGCVGTGHAWYIPAYTLLALGAAGGTDRYSLDALLSAKLPWYPFRISPPGSIGASGLARALVMLCVVFVMLNAGLSKLLDAGPSWITGETLRQYMAQMAGDGGPKESWLRDLMVANPALCFGAALFTFVIELGAPMLLFSKRVRLPYVLAAWGFHLGIMAVMVPKYLPQMVCYLLLIDFGAIFRRFGFAAPAVAAPPPEKTTTKKKAKKKRKLRLPDFSPRVRQISAAVGVTVSAVLFVATVIRSEFYPFSHIPMYSSLLAADIRGGLPLRDWEDPVAFQGIARAFMDDGKPWIFQSYVGRQVQLVVRTPRGPQRVTMPVLQRLLPGERTVWVKRAAWAVARDVTARALPEQGRGNRGQPVYDLTQTAGARNSDELLKLVIPTAREMGLDQRGQDLELVYMEKGFVLVLARASLAPS
jgi:hypothetical protein